MAKKKAAHQDKPSQNQKEAAAAMEEVVEKIETLKSLNAMLLKETVERRQQVDSLQQSNGCLESELVGLKSERTELESELTRLGECSLMMEMERSLTLVFVGVQVAELVELIEKERVALGREKLEIEKRLVGLEGEMRGILKDKSAIEKVKGEKESEIRLLKKKLSEVVGEIEKEKDVSNRVIRERDEIRCQLHVQIEETNGLKLKLIETETREEEIRGEIEKLRVKYDRVIGEREERERKIDLIMREKDCIDRSMVESHRVIEGLKKDVEEMVREKEGVEAERNGLVVKRNELENAVSSLNDVVLNLQNEEEKLRGNVAVLEKKCDEGVEKEKQMIMEIGVLMEEKREREKSLERLIDEKGLVMKDLDEALKQLDKQKGRVEEIAKEKSVMEAAKDKEESEIVELKRQVARFKDTIQSLEESSRGEMEKIRGLESVISQYRAVLDRITTERDEARKGLNEEKLNGMKLMEKIMEKEKSIEETNKVVKKMKDEKGNLIEQKKELESHYTVLKEDLASMENKLAEAQKELDNMQTKVGLADAKLEIILNMLKNTATLVSQAKDESEMVDPMKAGEEVKAYAAELEEIKNAFKNRESTLEDMKQQMESLQHSEAAHKRSFWTLVTSATTLLCAASVAYVARGH